MKVLLLCRYHRDGSSSRVRFMQYIPYLEANGIKVVVSPLLYKNYIKVIYSGNKPSYTRILFAYIARLFVLLNIRKYDVLWIEKELFPGIPAWFELALSVLGKRYVVDYDDATFLNYQNSLFPNKIAKVMLMSSYTICGNSFLMDYALKVNTKKTKYLPTVVDLNSYSIGEPKNNGVVIIGWIGAPSTVHYLYSIMDTLVTLSEHMSIELHVVGAFFDHPGVEIKCIPWSEKDESKLIQEFDIGIMPLSNSSWEKGKCAYKLIQYMACGLPVIGTDIGANKDVIVHGESGFLAKSNNDWLRYLGVLISSAEQRSAMGKAGRSIVEKSYCTKVALPILKGILMGKEELQ